MYISMTLAFVHRPRLLTKNWALCSLQLPRRPAGSKRPDIKRFATTLTRCGQFQCTGEVFGPQSESVGRKGPSL